MCLIKHIVNNFCPVWYTICYVHGGRSRMNRNRKEVELMKKLTLPIATIVVVTCCGSLIPSDMKFKMAYLLLGLALGFYWSHKEVRNEC